MNCGQINTPTIDTTDPACTDFLGTDCISQTTAITYLSLPAGSTQTQINNALLASLIDARNRIAALENNL